MSKRFREIVLLLGSLLDAPFAQPQSWTSQLVRRNAKRGEVPSSRIPCPACNGQRRRRVRTIMLPCDRCLGAQGKPLGYLVVDGMIEERYRRRIATAETGISIELKSVPCDRCGGRGSFGNGHRCAACQGGGLIEILKSSWLSTRSTAPATGSWRPSDPVLTAMEARAAAGSYDELDRALQALRREWPSLYRLTVRRYVLGEDLGELNGSVERLGLGYLSANLPDELRVPAALRAKERAA